MFSVGATPFNSAARQLYGGWTVAEAGDNIWGKKQAYEMQARYSADAGERRDARRWLRMYRVAAQDPKWRAKVRAAGKNYHDKAVYPALTPEQKAAIYSFWLHVPFSEEAADQLNSRLARGAPYPGASITNFNRALGVPYLAEGTALPTVADYGRWRTVADLQNAFKANKGVNRSYTADEVAAEFGIDPQTAQAAMDAITARRRRVKVEPVVAL